RSRSGDQAAFSFIVPCSAGASAQQTRNPGDPQRPAGAAPRADSESQYIAESVTPGDQNPLRSHCGIGQWPIFVAPRVCAARGGCTQDESRRPIATTIADRRAPLYGTGGCPLSAPPPARAAIAPGP